VCHCDVSYCVLCGRLLLNSGRSPRAVKLLCLSREKMYTAEAMKDPATSSVTYQPLERLSICRPVERIAWIAERCRGKVVLDLGCFDETALIKEGTRYWLHGRIAEGAKAVVGIDNSPQIPAEGISTGPSSRIVPGDVTAIDQSVIGRTDIDVIVAGELIEHLPDTISFLRQLKRLFPGREFIASTPNATSLTNVLLAGMARESSHPDHLHVYSYKTLHTVCLRAGFKTWRIIPYHVQYTEMLLRARGFRRSLVKAVERAINLGESAFPLTSGGFLLNVTEM
jgi:2-polyprenyl-3-methyl-5-hydroxy-6-metoxy-1,4-benzoquinol methylase